METLLLGNGTILMSKQKSFEIDHLFSQLCNLLRQSVILAAKHLDLGLEISQPLLLALSTFEGSHTRCIC